jgi:mRNA interferase RelE/StbE
MCGGVDDERRCAARGVRTASAVSAQEGAYRVEIDGSAQRDLQRLPHKIAAAIVEFITGRAEDPHRLSKPLRGELASYQSARRGDYQVLLRIDEDPPEFDQQADPAVVSELVVVGDLAEFFGVGEVVGIAAAGAAGFSVVAGWGQAAGGAYLFDGDVGADDLGLQECLERPAAPVRLPRVG